MTKNYLKLAFKVLLRRKFFTFISLFCIALTLVVLMAAVAVLDLMFGPQPPEIHADRSLSVFTLKAAMPEGFHQSGPAGYVFLDRYVKTLPDVEAVTLHSVPGTVISYVRGERIRSSLKHTDAAFWKVTGFTFLEGSPFTEEDVREARPVAVINASTRRRFFGEEPAQGKWIEADGQRFRVVGTVEDVPVLRMVSFSDIWIPVTAGKTDSYRQEQVMGTYMATVLAHSRADFPAIKSEYRSRLGQAALPEGFTELKGSIDTPFEAVYHNLMDDPSSEGDAALLIVLLGGLAVLFMALPAVNLININVSRIMERSSEIGVRRTFGASSGALVNQFLVENLVLCLIGGAIGFALSYLVLQIIVASGIIPYARFAFNYRIFGYGLLFSVVFALLSGVYPAWHMSRLHPVDALKKGAL